jgi:hypothetical protein
VCPVRAKKPLLLAVCAVALLVLALGACGGGSANETTATTAATTTTAPTAAAAPPTSESPTTTGQTVDEVLLGVWANEQGIELEFMSDGAVVLRYQGVEAESSYSAKDGKISYIDFEPNEQGKFLPTEVAYRVDGDTLFWDIGGGGELTLTRK